MANNYPWWYSLAVALFLAKTEIAVFTSSYVKVSDTFTLVFNVEFTRSLI